MRRRFHKEFKATKAHARQEKRRPAGLTPPVAIDGWNILGMVRIHALKPAYDSARLKHARFLEGSGKNAPH